MSVVAGNVVTLPVLTNAWSSLGLPLSVSPNVTVIQGQGYAWTDGTTVRFRAGTQPGVVVIAFEVVDDPQPGSVQASASALAVVTVTAPPAIAQPPVAQDLQVPVAVGQKIVIQVPLTTNTITGLPIDPNGLSVRLNGFTLQSRTSTQTTGQVALDPNGDSFDYTAPETAGTDGFQYTVENSMGVQSSAAQVSIVIFQPPAGVAPSTVPSTYHLGYGASADLPVLDQASNPTGEALSLRIEPGSDQQALEGAVTADQQMHVQVPSSCPSGHQEGLTGCVFTVFYVAYALQTSALTPVTIVVDGSAAGLPPVAPDVYPAYSANRSTVTVLLGQYVTDPSGPVGALQLSFPDGGASHQGLTVTAPLSNEPQPLLYQVTDPGTKLSASGVIWLPGLKQVEPVVKANAPPVQLDAGGAGAQVALSEYFSVPSGYSVQGQAAQSEPAGIHVTGSGPSVTITADSSAGGLYDVEVAVQATGESGTVDLPIPVQVKGTISTPITIYAPTVQVSLDQTTTQTISLLQNVSDPAAEPSQLLFHLGGSSDSRVSYQQSGATLTITANGTAADPYNSTIPVTVSFGSQSKQFTIDVSAEPINLTFSLLPFAQTLDVGKATTFSLVPFVSSVATVAGQNKWHVTDVSGEPSGWTATPSGTSITINATSFQGSTEQLSYTVAADSNPSQTAGGTFSVTTESKPGAPTALAVTALVQNKQVEVNVSWNPPAQTGGNLPISYQVKGDGGAGPCPQSSGATRCTVGTGISAGQSYSFTVTASNSLGSSSASVSFQAPSEPGPPESVVATAGAAQATIQWQPPADSGSVGDYAESVIGYEVTSTPGGFTCTTTVELTCSIGGLTNGLAYTFSVQAENDLGYGTGQPSNSVTPFAPPSSPGPPTLTQNFQPSDQITIQWTPSEASGAAVSGYSVTCTNSGSSCAGVGISQPQGLSQSAAATVTDGAEFGQSLQFSVAADYSDPNNLGTVLQSSPASSSIIPQAPPTWNGAPAPQTGVDTSTATLDWTSNVSTNGANVTYRVLEAVGNGNCKGGSPIASNLTGTTYQVTGLTAGKTYCFQIEADYSLTGGSPGTVVDPAATSVTTDPTATISNVAVCTVTSGTYQVSWTSSTSSATYSIFEGSSPLDPSNLPGATAIGLTTTSYDLTPSPGTGGTTYIGIEPSGFNAQLATITIGPSPPAVCS